MFTSLSDEFYYVGLGGQGYGPAYNSTYSGNSIISSKSYGSRNSGLRHSGSRELDPRRGKYSDYDRRDHEPRSNSRIVPNRQNAIPPVSRGNSGGVASGRQNGRDDQGRSQGQRAGSDRPSAAVPNRGPRSVQSGPSFDHRSNVLEREGRQNAQRREVENHGRSNR